MLELWATGLSLFLSSLIHTCLSLIPAPPHCRRVCLLEVLPKCSPSISTPGNQDMAPLAMGAAAMIQVSNGALELLGRMLHLKQKTV